jgi:hypothetical protein
MPVMKPIFWPLTVLAFVSIANNFFGRSIALSFPPKLTSGAPKGSAC